MSTWMLSSGMVALFGPREVARGNLRTLPPGAWLVEIRLPGKAVEPDAIDIRFRDHRDIRWRRGPLGNLAESPKTSLDFLEPQRTALLGWNAGNEVQTLFAQPLEPK
jgi:hypothetical protein